MDMHKSIRVPISGSVLFRGRAGDPRLGEWVKPLNAETDLSKGKVHKIALLGCADDQGVTLNRGRAGAKEGPDSIRKHLYKMTPPMDLLWEKTIALYDFGNLIAADEIIETHRRAETLIKELVEADFTVVALGGGHDFAAPNFFGMAAGFSGKKKPRLGLINVDPHFDVRELENGKPNSGTPFRQILESKKLEGKDFVQFGIQANRNSRPYFNYCREKKVSVLSWETLKSNPAPLSRQYAEALAELAKHCSPIGATFDMDACAEGEGVSSPPVVGFSSWDMVQMAEAAGRCPKVGLFEIAEVAPPLDPNERSSRTAAEMIYSFCLGRTRALSRKS
jgi:formiminoglutamase